MSDPSSVQGGRLRRLRTHIEIWLQDQKSQRTTRWSACESTSAPRVPTEKVSSLIRMMDSLLTLFDSPTEQPADLVPKSVSVSKSVSYAGRVDAQIACSGMWADENTFVLEDSENIELFNRLNVHASAPGARKMHSKKVTALLDSGDERDNLVALAFVVKLGCRDAIEDKKHRLKVVNGKDFPVIGSIDLKISYLNVANEGNDKYECFHAKFWVAKNLPYDDMILCEAIIEAKGLRDVARSTTDKEYIRSQSLARSGPIRAIVRLPFQSKKEKQRQKLLNQQADREADKKVQRLQRESAAQRANMTSRITSTPGSSSHATNAGIPSAGSSSGSASQPAPTTNTTLPAGPAT